MTDLPPDRGRTAFRYDGNDVGVLLIHGFTGAPGSMRPWADHLVAEGYTVSLPVLPGHGTRWQDANRTTFDDWLAAVTSELRQLTERCRSVVVGGLSMGGTLTLRLAELYPDAMAGIMLVNPSVLTLHWEAKLLPVLHRVLPSFPPIKGDIAKPGTVEPGYTRLPVKAMHSLWRAWPVVRQDLDKVTAPVLLLHSRVDHTVEPINSQIVREGLRSTEVTDIELERSYHVATLDYDAELIFSSSVEFIEKVTAGLP
ncbi:alpha/beta hydrolase [Nakamurella sp. GG22]